MKYVVPKVIEFTSTNVPEESLAEWAVESTYNQGEEIKVSLDKKKYKYAGLDGTNTTTEPSLNPYKWVSSPLNKFAMLVDNNSSETENPDSIDVVFNAINIDSISLFNVDAKEIDIKIKHNLITTETVGVGDGIATDFSHYTNVIPFVDTVEIYVDGVIDSVVPTIDYLTGLITISFSVAPFDTQVIEVKYNALLFSENKDMTYDDLSDFGDYLFSEQELRNKLNGSISSVALDNVIASMSETQINSQFTANPPIYYDVEVHISIIKNGNIAKCGYVVVGRKQDLGCSLYGGSIGLQTTASRDRDSWGNVVFTTGKTYNTMDVPVLIDANYVDVVENRLRKIMNVPCVFIGDDSDIQKYESMTLYGFYYNLEAPITVSKTEYNLRIESLIW